MWGERPNAKDFPSSEPNAIKVSHSNSAWSSNWMLLPAIHLPSLCDPSPILLFNRANQKRTASFCLWAGISISEPTRGPVQVKSHFFPDSLSLSAGFSLFLSLGFLARFLTIQIVVECNKLPALAIESDWEILWESFQDYWVGRKEEGGKGGQGRVVMFDSQMTEKSIMKPKLIR